MPTIQLAAVTRPRAPSGPRTPFGQMFDFGDPTPAPQRYAAEPPSPPPNEAEDIAEDEKREPAPSSPPTIQQPAPTWRDVASVTWGALRALPRAGRRGLLAAPTLLALVLGIVCWPQPRRGFMKATHILHGGPSPDNVFTAVALLERGEPLEVLGNTDAMLLVRDPLGRVGYVDPDFVVSDAPPVHPDRPFSRCHLRPSEFDNTACYARAHEQRQRCGETCDADNNAACTDVCRQRFSECLSSCDGVSPSEIPAKRDDNLVSDANKRRFHDDKKKARRKNRRKRR